MSGDGGSQEGTLPTASLGLPAPEMDVDPNRGQVRTYSPYRDIIDTFPRHMFPVFRPVILNAARLHFCIRPVASTLRNCSTHTGTYTKTMAKKKSNEGDLILPAHASTASIVDTHTHLASTYAAYRGKFKDGKFETVHEFVRGMYEGKNVEAIIDVWCEAPVQRLWKEFADSALTKEDRDTKWGGMEYWFVMGEL